MRKGEVVMRKGEATIRKRKRALRRARNKKRLQRRTWRGNVLAVGVVLCIALSRLSLGWGEHIPSEAYPAEREETGRTVAVHTVETRSAQISQHRDLSHFSMAPLMQIWEGETQVELRLEYEEDAGVDLGVRLYPTGYPLRVLYESGPLSPGETRQYVELEHPLPVGRNSVTVESYGGVSEKSEVTIDVLPAELNQSG